MDLLESSSKLSYGNAIEALGNKLNLEGKAVAAQDFRHLAQRAGETVVEFISRLERSFRKAYRIVENFGGVKLWLFAKNWHWRKNFGELSKIGDWRGKR